MRTRTSIAAALWLVALPSTLWAQGLPSIQREVILDVRPDPARTVGAVKGARIRFAPGQQSGRHLHPIPTVGVVTEGSFRFQPEGQAVRVLKKGDAFFEPAGVPILEFDNASDRDAAEIVAFYLQDDPASPLVQMQGGPAKH